MEIRKRKMRIIFISYVDTECTDSGSSVRPLRMLEAFKESGHDVVVLTGSQMASNRKAKIREVLQKIQEKPVDLCYIESSTYPIMLHKDRKLIKVLCHMGIPTGYFYRDFYRKFPELFPRRKGFVNGLKEFYIDIMQWLTDRVLRYCDIVYFPSDKSHNLFSYRDMRTLPPAGEYKISDFNHSYNTIIYVGGVTELYDFDTLIRAMKIVYKQNKMIKLIVVCREKEWNKIKHKYYDISWMEIYHTSGTGLEPLYRKADIGILTKKRNEYNEMAVSVKLFEYISYGLPVISTHSETTDKIINDLKIGITVEDNEKAIANGIEQLLCYQKKYMEYCENIKYALKNSCQWKHRVEQVIHDLIMKNKEVQCG